MWVVDIGVPFSDKYDAYELATEFELQVVGRYSDSAGGGFGYRDLQFECDSYREAFAIWASFETFRAMHQDIDREKYYCGMDTYVRLP